MSATHPICRRLPQLVPDLERRFASSGFVSLDSDATRGSKGGSGTTDAFSAPGQHLWVNYLALVPGSSLAVELLSPSGKVLATSSAKPGGDQLRRHVEWANGRNLTVGARVQLRFVLSGGAKIFSYWLV